MSEEALFPRGGPNLSEKAEDVKETKTRHANKRMLSQQDFLFGEKKKTKKKRKTQETTDGSSKKSLLPLGGGGVISNKIEPIGFSRLHKGTKLLGMVREVHEDFCVVSLPNMLTCYVLKKSDEEPLTQCVYIGQPLNVVVFKTVTETLKSGPRRRIQVDISPAAVNPRTSIERMARGKVRSIEDHGLFIDLGHGRKGFLSYDDIDDSYIVDESVDNSDNPQHLHPGRLEDFIVKPYKGKDTVVIPLALKSRREMAKHVISLDGDAPPPLSSLSPGWLVRCRIEALARNGLLVDFGNGVYRGAIDLPHLGGTWIPDHRQESTEWKKVFSTLRHIDARILAVDANTKLVRLTLRPHLMNLEQPSWGRLSAQVGKVVDSAVVVRLDPGFGALLALPDPVDGIENDKTADNETDANAMKEEGGDMELGDEKDKDRTNEEPKSTTTSWHKLVSSSESYRKATQVQTIYVHISKAMDGRTPDSTFSKHFAPSTKHKVRVLNTSGWIEHNASGATAESVLQAHVLTHSDLVPGRIYRNVPVCAHLGEGILCDFGMGVRGMIQPMHLFDHQTSAASDYRVKMRKAKFAIDAKVDVRVLTVDPRTKRCKLTAKKSLLKSDIENPITAYDKVKAGQVATGFVSKIDDDSLFVTFYNGVYGRVTARSMAAELGVDDHKENYHVGDVVQCRVVRVAERSREKPKFSNEADSDDDIEEMEPSKKKTVFVDLLLSLRVEAGENEGGEAADTSPEFSSRTVHLRAGGILPPKSMKIVQLIKGRVKEGGLYVPGYAIVRVKSKYLIDEAECATMVPYMDCKLPYDQLLDDYDQEDTASAETLDSLAENLLVVGKKIKQRGLILTDPRKSGFEHVSGTGRLTIVSIKPELIETAEQQLSSQQASPMDLILPAPETPLYTGAKLHGFVTHIHHRHGAFIRFLDGLTGLIPKSKGGLQLALYSTIVCRVIEIDSLSRPPKILLEWCKKKRKHKAKSDSTEQSEKKVGASWTTIKVGDTVSKAVVKKLTFYNAELELYDDNWTGDQVKARIHVTMADSSPLNKLPGRLEKPLRKRKGKLIVTKYHPFHGWTRGMKLTGLTVVALHKAEDLIHLELSNQQEDSLLHGGPNEAIPQGTPRFIESPSQLLPGMKTSGIITEIPRKKTGVWVQVSPGVKGFIPSLELSTDPDVLNKIRHFFPIGCKLECSVMDEKAHSKNRSSSEESKGRIVFLSRLLRMENDHPSDDKEAKEDKAPGSKKIPKPRQGDLVVGRINRRLKPMSPPALMLELRGGFVGRCCITELLEPDEWVNLPLGREERSDGKDGKSGGQKSSAVDKDQDGGSGARALLEADHENDDAHDEAKSSQKGDLFPDGQFVQCRVMASSRSALDVSLRPSRLEGDLDEDEPPEVGELVQGFVISTNKACFVRLGSHVEGRVILKEICDGFLPNPAASFPMGRLVVGKVKQIHDASLKGEHRSKKNRMKIFVDLDMRESSLLDQSERLTFDDIELQSKHKGTVTRIEPFGVFVQIENSDVSGLVYKGECSDKFVRDPSRLFDPGDTVKVLVIKKDNKSRKLGFSMKASHFKDDDDSDDSDEEMEDVSSGSDSEEENADANMEVEDDLDSDDENFGAKLAAKMKASGELEDSDSDDDTDDDDSESEEDSSDDEDDSGKKPGQGLDTDVGFEWGASGFEAIHQKNKKADESDEETESDESDDEDGAKKSSSHKSRKKQAERRRREQEISQREAALADGTADENPETAADFERLLAGDPNSSEIWIRYMAFHLSLADIPSARAVAERAFDRIEFRQEHEKLNVWTALLTLELKYGSPDSLQTTIDRACRHNNPKQVYLRVCEMLEKEASSSSGSDKAVERADTMFAKMCQKFKSKKKVWIAHLQYLLKSGRADEGQDLLKRAVKSLPSYKHVETMSKFAQLEYEFGSAERARTIFDGILEKYPKRLDVLFVYLDKEVKFGTLKKARVLLEQTVSEGGKMKLSDKQMKSLFKKWYRIEEVHGTEESQEDVKAAAKDYVERTSSM